MTDHHSDQHSCPLVEDIYVVRADDTNVLRAFQADIQLIDDMGEVRGPIGSVNGLTGRVTEYVDLAEAADLISADVAPLGLAADEIQEWHHEERGVIVEDVIMVEMIRLKTAHRGHRLAGQIIDEIIDFFLLSPTATLVVLLPEPQQDGAAACPMVPSVMPLSAVSDSPTRHKVQAVARHQCLVEDQAPVLRPGSLRRTRHSRDTGHSLDQPVVLRGSASRRASAREPSIRCRARGQEPVVADFQATCASGRTRIFPAPGRGTSRY